MSLDPRDRLNWERNAACKCGQATAGLLIGLHKMFQLSVDGEDREARSLENILIEEDVDVFQAMCGYPDAQELRQGIYDINANAFTIPEKVEALNDINKKLYYYLERCVVRNSRPIR